MSNVLKIWLQQNTERLVRETLFRAPQMLPGEEDIADFIGSLGMAVDLVRDEQLSQAQFWAITCIGHDSPLANDWQTVLTILKETLLEALARDFTPVETLQFWRRVEHYLTYALVEATQLAVDMQRSALVQQMVDLREQMVTIEQTKTKFIAVAAHELKTPITIVQGYANMLRVELADDATLLGYVSGIDKGITRMSEVIEDVVDVSQLDLRTFELSWTQFYVEKVVLMAADSMGKYFEERNVELVVYSQETAVRTYGDPDRIKSAVMKLLFNALKYTPDGGQVTIQMVRLPDEEKTAERDGFLDIRISDTGIGIAKGDLERIFERFQTLGSTSFHSSSKTKFKGGGPGLGLPIANGIVEAHGGRIWAESPGVDEEKLPGSTFHLELPIWLEEPELDSLEMQAEE